MLKRPLILTAILVAVLVFFRECERPDEARGGSTPTGSTAKDATWESESGEGSERLPTKSANRREPGPKATHPPERLREFYLPEVAIEGLTLEAALRKLQEAYEDACRESGERPLRLVFTVPSGKDRPLHLKLGGRTLDASVRMLAAASGLKVTRVGSEYRFEAPVETGKAVKRVVQVSPDFQSWWTSAGVELDPSTRLDFDSTNGRLTIETTSAADELALTSLLNVRAKETPVQQKLQTRVLELKADADWTPPDLSQLDEAEMQLLMRSMAQMAGTELLTMPSTVARAGEPAKIELTREWITPVPGTSDAFETRNVGLVLDLTTVPLGFGHRVAMDFSDTTGEVDPESGEASIIERTAIADTSFAADGNARLHLQTRPDGTRTLVLVTPTLIDATGRPVRGGE